MCICRFFSTFAADMNNLPRITKNLLLANLVMWLATIVMQRWGLDLNGLLGLHYVSAQSFHWWQPFTYMFMHADFTHLFCNMFAVLMFGPALENQWGENKYLIYYIVTGLGAAFVQECVWAIQIQSMLSTYAEVLVAGYSNQILTIGASGAVFGILLAFGWLFPDVKMFLLFIPIPIRARVFVILYALFELFAGLAPHAGDNVAHFAHLGGMLFGVILILWWEKFGNTWKFPRIKRPKDDVEDEGTTSNGRRWHYRGSV